VAGLGLTGFALGFALKDTISNLLSGILILLYQPFKIGNTIKVSGYEGDVVSIDLRYTELNSEGNKILIPNSKLFTDPIIVLQ
jgi:small-conductance mechanosensitive channel